MKMITDYKILRFDDEVDLTVYVKDGLNNGWQPYGDLIIFETRLEDDVFMEFVQAMVKYEI